ncbi:MAG: VOC family protein [Candidatus Melainabacteria bacterium]|nr:VOC family protein [Candidatus Melainabacteria bacterium]
MQKKWIPEGHHVLTTYLVVKDADKFVEFVEKTFGGETTVCMRQEGKIGHAEIKIGDSKIMLGEQCSEFKTTSCGIYIYVEDCDAVYHRALKNGASTIHKPADQFYGDRSGGVLDAWGNSWWIATHIEAVSQQELQKRVEAIKKEPALKK